MKSMLKRSTYREIKGSLGRYLAIMAIVALGVGFFAGLRVTKPAMIQTANTYVNQQNLYDFRLISTLGFEEKDLNSIKTYMENGIAEGAYSSDVICVNKDGLEQVIKIHSITDQVNKVELKSGRMPKEADECVIDSYYLTASGFKIGDTITLSDTNEGDTLDLFSYKEYTIVGAVSSPIYMNFERGTTSLGNGKIACFVYMNKAGFHSDYYTELDVSYGKNWDIYSKEYKDFIKEQEPEMKKEVGAMVTARYESILKDANHKIEDAKTELDDQKTKAQKDLSDGKQKLVDGQLQLDEQKHTLDQNNKDLINQKAQIEAGLLEIETNKSQLALLGAQADPVLVATIITKEEYLKASLLQVNQGLQKIKEGQSQVEVAQEKLDENNKSYEDSLAEFNTKIADGEEKIKDAQDEVSKIKEPDYYVLGRNTNVGYVCFESDSNIVAGISTVFPIFFFMVAALVCITTMNRMVEEQRTQIGVLKALGYSRRKIMGKYTFYAGSAAMIGGILGFLAGSLIFPYTIWQAYAMMYGFGEIQYLFDLPLALISMAVAMICAVGATYFSCVQELNSVAAELVRPKAPKNGKRIVLEKIGFIWNRFSFLHKVSIRNMIRYKKRFFMMVIGISGCTALLVTGFGIKDSIADVAKQQYSEIQLYDGAVSFEDPLSEKQKEDFVSDSKAEVDSVLFAQEETVDIEANGKIKSLFLVVPNQVTNIDPFFNLHTKDQKAISYPKKNQVVITEKIAKKLGVGIGDMVTLRDTDLKEMKVEVVGINENFVSNYAYISPDTYLENRNQEPEYKTAYVNVKQDKNVAEASAKLMSLDHVTSVTVNDAMLQRFQSMMKSLDYIVILVIICAGMLAFIVLYNLTNINITERIREIATIKVLGFYPKETAHYVFRENMVLTGIGALVGILLGKMLHGFVMYNIDIDMVSFDVRILPLSYVYSVAFTFLFGMIVNQFMKRKLHNIKMAESLKSIE